MGRAGLPYLARVNIDERFLNFERAVWPGFEEEAVGAGGIPFLSVPVPYWGVLGLVCCRSLLWFV